MIKAVLFDMDGTIVNSERHYIDGTVEYLKENGINVTRKDVVPIIGTTMEVTYDILSKLSGIDRNRIIELNSEYFGVRNPLNYKDVVFEDTLPCFQKLKEEDIKIAICSMSDTEYVEKCIEDIGLHDYVDYYIGGTSVTHQKPDPEIYLKAVETLKLDKEEVIIVEDAVQGIEAGKNAGIYTLARKDVQFGLDQSEADRIIDDLSEVIKVIKNG